MPGKRFDMQQHISLCVFLFGLAISGGCGGSPKNAAEAESVAAILKLNGKVEYDEKSPDRPVLKVYLHSTAVKDEDLSLVKKLTKLQNLFLGKTKIGDAGLEHLKGAAELRTLSLNATQVTDQGLKSLTELKNLKTLNLQDTKVTEAGIKELRQAIPGITVAH